MHFDFVNIEIPPVTERTVYGLSLKEAVNTTIKELSNIQRVISGTGVNGTVIVELEGKVTLQFELPVRNGVIIYQRDKLVDLISKTLEPSESKVVVHIFLKINSS